MKNKLPDCAHCPVEPARRLCQKEGGLSPDWCPTRNRDLIDRCLQIYGQPEIQEFARVASVQEGEGYGGRELGYDRVKPVKPRILEIIEFARRMKFNRLGLVFCVGLRNEAEAVGSLFADHGFEVVSVSCKAGGLPKETIGVRNEEKINVGMPETMCNPVMQALVLNSEKTDLNVVMGLCVGHDSLFFKHSRAPCTVLAAKDRLLGHNPLAAVYTLNSYYRSLKKS
ncbi:DUF1847 domain-containing protein [bacterium]|nr:DUF1847 domain-containing protein [candidate division CSSED10-310 bacterium]